MQLKTVIFSFFETYDHSLHDQSPRFTNTEDRIYARQLEFVVQLTASQLKKQKQALAKAKNVRQKFQKMTLSSDNTPSSTTRVFSARDTPSKTPLDKRLRLTPPDPVRGRQLEDQFDECISPPPLNVASVKRRRQLIPQVIWFFIIE